MAFIPEWAFVKGEGRAAETDPQAAHMFWTPSGWLAACLALIPHPPGLWTQEPIAVALFLLRRRLRLTGKAKVRPKPLELGT